MRPLTYEFIVPSGIYLSDIAPWNSLAVTRNGVGMQIRKPLAGQQVVRVGGTVGNEGVDLHYSVMNVDLEAEDDRQNPDWSVPFQLVVECLDWIRILGRQYLVSTLNSGSYSLARGSIISGGRKYVNFGAIQPSIVVAPLSREMWERIGNEIASCNAPGIPDSMLCDAMVKLHEGDFLQAVTLLGVTAELELNSFIADLLTLQSESLRKLYDEKGYKFHKKLKDVLEALGAESYHDHNAQFAGQLIKIYEFRGQAVHRAKCTIDGVEVGFGHVARFIYVVEDFLRWTKGQRKRLGLKTIEPFDSPIKAMWGD